MIALWLTLTVLLLVTGHVMLKACGVTLWGLELSWCPRDRGADFQRLNALLRQIHTLQNQKADPAQCGVPLGGVPSAIAPSGEVQMTPGAIELGLQGVTPPIGRTTVGDGQTLGALDGKPVDGTPAQLTGLPPEAIGRDVPSPDTSNLEGESDVAQLPVDPDLGNGDAHPDADGSASAALDGGTPGSSTPAPGAAAPNAEPAAAPPPGGNPGAPPAAPASPPPGSPPGSPPGVNCPPGQQAKPYIVLALDHSKSMGLPTDMDDDLATRLEILMEQGGPAGRKASRTYNGYVNQEGRKRIDVLKDSVAQLSTSVDQNIDFGVVTFAGCGGVVDLGNYNNARRPRLVEKVRRLQVEPATPAAEALQTAIAKASSVRGGRVILVSDGKDTCDADPCAVAQRSDGVRVDVISMGGGDVLACVAEATSGRMITPNAEQSVEDILVSLGASHSAETCQ